MHDPDDRLAGDHIWELLTPPTVVLLAPTPRIRRHAPWLAVAAFITPLWFLNRSAAVAATCLAFAIPEIRKGREFARAIPVKAGGSICARFTYAWAAWKCAMSAIVLFFMTAIAAIPAIPAAQSNHANPPPAEFMTALLIAFAAILTSSALTASSLLIAYRSGMRLWLGEGINRARTLLTAMLIVVFLFVAILPLLIWLSRQNPRAADQTYNPIIALLALSGCLFIGALTIVILLDRLSDRLISTHPGKFGPKVPTVGHWNPPDPSAHVSQE